MLPNWLYGKSKSKLASILGGGGGTPADYNQVKAQVTQNAEDIELLSDALDTKAALTQISNPNLLDNPWFTVNQRGHSTYNVTENGMTVDRWAASVSSGTMIVEVTSNGLTITEASDVDDGGFIERINKPDLLGKTVTISIDDGTNIYHATDTIPNVQPENWTEVCSVTTSGGINASLFISPVNITAFQLQYVIRVPKDNTAHAIRAVKLELGSVSTLAMDTTPNYATELLKCQRYFIRYSSPCFFEAYTYNETTARFGIPLTVPMRNNPAFSVNDITNLQLICNGTGQALSSSQTITNSGFGTLQKVMQIDGIPSGSFTSNYLGALKMNAGYIDLSADL